RRATTGVLPRRMVTRLRRGSVSDDGEREGRGQDQWPEDAAWIRPLRTACQVSRGPDDLGPRLCGGVGNQRPLLDQLAAAQRFERQLAMLDPQLLKQIRVVNPFLLGVELDAELSPWIGRRTDHHQLDPLVVEPLAPVE